MILCSIQQILKSLSWTSSLHLSQLWGHLLTPEAKPLPTGSPNQQSLARPSSVPWVSECLMMESTRPLTLQIQVLCSLTSLHHLTLFLETAQFLFLFFFPLITALLVFLLPLIHSFSATFSVYFSACPLKSAGFPSSALNF